MKAFIVFFVNCVLLWFFCGLDDIPMYDMNAYELVMLIAVSTIEGRLMEETK
jgi:hypothetical protein